MSAAVADREVRFCVEAWAGWREEDDTWTRGGALAPARSLPVLLRRRITPIGRRALEAAWSVLPDGPMPRLVLSSRHGEYDRTFGLLQELAAGDSVSPADFSLSVHHALAGLLSITTGSTAGHTALSAGPDSFGFGLIEAAGCVVEDRAGVILLHFDAPLPELYQPVIESRPPARVLALRLAPDSGLALALTLRPSPPAPGDPGLTDSFLRLLAGEADVSARGARFEWQWRRREGHDDA